MQTKMNRIDMYVTHELKHVIDLIHKDYPGISRNALIEALLWRTPLLQQYCNTVGIHEPTRPKPGRRW